MNALPFPFRGETLHALPSGALHWPARRLLCISDLHFGKSARMARRDGALLPPYETLETLTRLADDIAATDPVEVICLGDSFDDLAAAREIDGTARTHLISLMAGRRWIWIEGNHDPGPLDFGGTHLASYRTGPLIFRHIAQEETNANGPGAAQVPDATSISSTDADPLETGGQHATNAQDIGEVSGHYHPKARLRARGRTLSRRCFLLCETRLILPAYGTYTGGLHCDHPDLARLMGAPAHAILLGPRPVLIPMPR